MRQRIRSILCAITLLVLSFPLLLIGVTLAQEGGLRVEIDRVDDQKYPTVRAYVTVTEERGLDVKALSEESFQVFEDETPAELESVSRVPPEEAEGVALGLAIDVSGSMDGLPLDTAQSATHELLNKMRPNDEAALISFGDDAQIRYPLTADPIALHAAVDELEAGGKTALYDAIFQGAEILADAPLGRKALVVLSDGEDVESQETLENAIARAQEAKVPVYTVGYGYVDQLAEFEAVLRQVASETGGAYFAAPEPEDMKRSFEAIADLLTTQYEVVFKSNVPADDTAHALRLVVTHEGQTGEATGEFISHSWELIVTLTGPTDGSQVGGKVSFTIGVQALTDEVEVVSVVYSAGPLSGILTTPPYTFDWDTTTVEPGPYTVNATATDRLGNSGQASLSIVVVPPVTVRILAPLPGAKVQGELNVTVAPEVAPNGQLDVVELYWNGELVEARRDQPWTFSVDLRQTLGGEYDLLVRARDTSGHEHEAMTTVTVKEVTSLAGLWWVLAGVALLVLIVIPLAWRRRRATGAAVAPVPSAPTTAWLVIEKGSRPGWRFLLKEGETRLGRSRADNDIKLEGVTASRRQAVVQAGSGQFVYADLPGTSNRTIINGREIAAPHTLHDGDRLEIGDMTLRFTRQEG